MDRGPTSYGVLLYRRQGATIQYLLGKIPQGNWWTVFKGLPEPYETPEETALREFAEETGSTNALTSINSVATLRGKAGKKNLSIFLQDGSDISESIFDIDNVVKIDQGYMEGRPEIIAIRWLSLEEAMEGTDGAKIYNSQQTILRQAETYISEES